MTKAAASPDDRAAGLAMLRPKPKEIFDDPIYCQSIAGVLALLAVLAAPVRAQDGKAPDYAAIVAAPDRAEADRQADVRRKPAQLLAFTEVKSGMKVLDMETSAGYSAELLARSSGLRARFMRRIPRP
jgi:hypothetical protein